MPQVHYATLDRLHCKLCTSEQYAVDILPLPCADDVCLVTQVSCPAASQQSQLLTAGLLPQGSSQPAAQHPVGQLPLLHQAVCSARVAGHPDR